MSVPVLEARGVTRVLPGPIPVRGPDLVGRRRLGNAQDLVVRAVRAHG